MFSKNDKRNTSRLVIVAFFIFFLFCLILIQFYRLQIIEGDKWYKIACAQHHIEVTENFKRGCFYSNTEIKKDHPQRKKVPFVVDIPKFHLYIDPFLIEKKHKLIIAKKLF